MQRSSLPYPRLAAAVLLGGLVLGTAGAARAVDVDHFVFGQVFGISSKKAADASIPAAGLTGDPLPFVQVQVYDRSSGALLGKADAGQNGQFTVKFPLPVGVSPDIDARVYRIVDQGATLIPEARAGIDSFSAIGPNTGAALKVVSDDLVPYGNAGFGNYPGVGLLFTRVGKVETRYISQDTALSNRPVAGLADFDAVPGGPARAGELGVPVFDRAPFGSRLLVFGDFGQPGGACLGSQIDWYQVRIKKIAEAPGPVTYETDALWQEPMNKIRTQVTTLPTLSVTQTTVSVGPYAGFLDNLATPPPDAGTPVAALYQVNRNQVGGLTSTFYSFPDLRVNWLSGEPRVNGPSTGANGLYELSVVYYRQVGTAPSGGPIVRELPASCFTGSPPPNSGAALNKLVLRVDNHSLFNHIDHIYLKKPGPGGGYFAGNLQPDSPTPVGAVDFTGTGPCNAVTCHGCDILHLTSTYQVEIHFTAHHEGQYMNTYGLSAASNSGGVTVAFDSDAFGPHTTATNPFWSGTTAAGKAALQGGFSKACAYRFGLASSSRIQNGDDYIQRANTEQAFYVTP